MSILKKASTALVLVGLLSSSALADAHHPSSSNEGKMVFKARLGYLNVQAKTSDLEPGDSLKFKNGYTGDLALGYFFTDNIAVEGSVGYGRTKLKDVDFGNKNINLIPLTATLQYHFMPEASVSPYVGLGYSYQFTNGSPTNTKIKNGGGVVGQVGLDIPFNDTMAFNVDVKYTYRAQHNIKVTEPGEPAYTIKNKLTTTAVTVGVAFPF
jgi:outer membrane protein